MYICNIIGRVTVSIQDPSILGLIYILAVVTDLSYYLLF